MKWDQELYEYRLSKAYETLKDATILANSKRWNSCVNRLYYACFYAVLALLMKDDKSSSKHTGIRSIFNKDYIKTKKIPLKFGQLYNSLFEGRQESDYLPYVYFTEEQVLPWLKQATSFIDFIAELTKKNK